MNINKTNSNNVEYDSNIKRDYSLSKCVTNKRNRNEFAHKETSTSESDENESEDHLRKHQRHPHQHPQQHPHQHSHQQHHRHSSCSRSGNNNINKKQRHSIAKDRNDDHDVS